MNKWSKWTSLILVAVCSVLWLTGCGLGPETMEGAELAVLAYAEPATDNLVASFESDDYTQFSRDLAPEMLQAMSESSFHDMVTMLDTKVGAYVSRQVTSIEESDGYIAVFYDVQHANEEHVTMRVVFDQNQKVSGLWFDSPKLRE